MQKVSVVTGGGSGIGKAVAKALPKENVVIITGRNEKKLQSVVDELNQIGHNIVAITCDVTKRKEVENLAQYAKSLGDIQCVIHCAGISGNMGTVEQIIRTNALGTVYINQEFYKVMKGGCIVDVASNSGYILPSIFIPKKSYPIVLNDEDKFVKKAVRRACILHKESINVQLAYMISKNFAKWYSQKCSFKYMQTKGIRVVSVSPGFVETPIMDKEKCEYTDTLLEYAGNRRCAKPEEIAYLLVSVANPKNSYLIGTDILCDAGCINNGFNFKTALLKGAYPSKEGRW